ncbi:hypothetical protein [Synechococcus sp. A15-127]|uniref:hypothetical protein n=1 Tax=Synechococcus sp. A15-127 TaxID=1050624 RepID=UPI001647503C|nr:hypothetical protein [Synechococcus sp. A15-127]
MESLFMQLAMAAMSQFGGGRSVPVSGGMPMPMPMRPLAPYSSPAPVSNGWQPSMQASVLACTTCLLRSGRISRDQSINLLDRQGATWGWTRGWGRSVPIYVVDRTIDSAGGCRALLNGNSPGRDWQGAPIQVADGDPGRSQREGFGLYPYR